MAWQGEVPANFGNIGSLSLNKPLTILNPPTPICVNVHDSIAAAIGVLQEHHIGCALVVDDDGSLVGIYSERDIVQKWVHSDLDADATTVEEIMTANPASLPTSGTVAAALYTMSKGGFRHLPIVDEDSKPVGILSIKDVMDFIAMEFMRNLFV